ncbi:MAG: hypothetical protein JWQ36_2820, partial [Enterovirga sp.]|nr:hypothetical protein [Enterovirga sp.]
MPGPSARISPQGNGLIATPHLEGRDKARS